MILSCDSHRYFRRYAGDCMNVMDGLANKLMPMAESVSKNKYLLTMRDSFAMLMPILIIGSMFTLVGNLPIPAWVDFLKATTIQGKSLFSLLAIPSACTVSLMAIFLSFEIGYNFADQLGLEDRVSAGMVSLITWFILMPQVTEFLPQGATQPFLVESIPLAWTGAKGVFVAIIVGFLSVHIFGLVIKKNWVIRMPEGVPTSVSLAFSALIPMSLTFLAIWTVGVLFALTPWKDAFTCIYSMLQTPLTMLGGTVWALAIAYVIQGIFWFFGINGSNITSPIFTPILTALTLENQAAFAAGTALPNIINREFDAFFALFGGGGSTLSLLIAIFLFCNSRRAKDIAKISIVPGVFGINEPVMYGLPIVLNPIMAIPLIFTPAINIAIAWSAMSAGLVPLCNGIMLPGSTPPLISGFLLCGWQGALLQLVLIALDMVIYLPFVKALDTQFLKEEEGAEPEVAV